MGKRGEDVDFQDPANRAFILAVDIGWRSKDFRIGKALRNPTERTEQMPNLHSARQALNEKGDSLVSKIPARIPARIFARRCALVLALMMLTAPASRMQGQFTSPTMNAVTGGDPQPTGEPPQPKPHAVRAMPSVVIAALIMLGLA